MNVELLQKKMDKYFAEVTPEDLVADFEKMGVEFESIRTTLSDPALYKKGHLVINKLIETGGRSFVMHVPARPNEDADLVLSEVVERFGRYAKRLHQYEEVFKWLLGEKEDFPTCEGKGKYCWRTNLRKKITEIKDAGK